MSYTRKSRIAQFLFLTTAILGFTLAAVYEHYRLAAAAMAVLALGIALKLIFGGSVEPRGGPPSVPYKPDPSCPGEPPFFGHGVISTAPAAPVWVYIAGAILTITGALSYSRDPGGTGPRTVAAFLLIPGGLLFIAAGSAYYGDSVTRRNLLYGTIALTSYFMIGGGIFVSILIAAGAFDQPEVKAYAALGVCSLLAGIAGFSYGMVRQRNREAIKIGREIGFSYAGSGPASPEEAYDAKGRMNGLEVLFKIIPGARAGVTLQVLCRCANPLGVKLEVRPEGFLGAELAFSSLSKIPSVPYWDSYEVRCNFPESAVMPLSEARKGGNVFTDAAGFTGMTLDGKDFKFNFFNGYADAYYVKSVLAEVSSLAAAFN